MKTKFLTLAEYAKLAGISHASAWRRLSAGEIEGEKRSGKWFVQVDDKDITGESENTGGGGCRLYIDEAGHYSGVPSAQAIVQALDLTLHSGADGY